MRVVVVLALFAGCAFAGCSDDGPLGTELVVGASEVPPDIDGSQFVSRSLQCRERAELEVTAQTDKWDKGTVSVVVKDGAGYLVGAHQKMRARDVPVREDVPGVAGSWTLEVRRSVEMDTPFSVALRC